MEDLRPYGALSVPVQERLKLVESLSGYGALAATNNRLSEDRVLLVPPNLAPYGALSNRVQDRLRTNFGGQEALPYRLTEDSILAGPPALNLNFSPGIQRNTIYRPYGALAGPKPVNF